MESKGYPVALNIYGLNLNDIGGVFISHVHEDHASLLELMMAGQRVRLFTTHEIYESLLIKIAALLGRDLNDEFEREALSALIDFKPIECGHSMDIYGAQFTPHYNIHSIPTFGGRFMVEHSGKNYQLLISGDCVGPQKLNEMEKDKGISSTLIRDARLRIQGNEDFIIYDGGADFGGLHADPADPELLDLAKDMGERFYYGHRSNKYLNDGSSINVAQAGFERVLLKENIQFEGLGAISKAFAVLQFEDALELKSLWTQGQVEQFSANTILCGQGADADSVYILLLGQVSVLVDGDEVATLRDGSIFGEMAVLNDRSRCATIVAKSPVRVLRVRKHIFVNFVEKHGLLPMFKQIWCRRKVLMEATVFKNLPSETIDSLTHHFEEVDFDAGVSIIKQGAHSDDAYLVTEGTVSVLRDDELVATLGYGHIFGEKSALFDTRSVRTATVVSDTACKLLRLDAAVLRELSKSYFAVNNSLHFLLRQRKLLKRVG